jgi:hypothetical protein
MMAGLADQATPWLAIAAMLLALFAAARVLAARSLFTAAVSVSALAACVSAALLALGQGQGPLALALLGAGVAPVLVLGGVLLSNRAAQPRAKGAPWLSIAAAVGAGAAMMWAAPSIGAAPAIKRRLAFRSGLR